ncbi:putative eukaryotic translation initiation factor 3 subunit F-like [Capsicum annuum]|nr:putative eukaryotic translation initiation factor 3 subunit F-like [Capsicum annuum]KAF3651101.1 putative eukaryotic translation initiation factor 3 subunit F-like [Capsicum annuum]
MPSAAAVSLVSKCKIFPSQKSSLSDFKLSVSNLPMLSVHYIQKGCLFTRPPFRIAHLISLLKLSLSQTLTHFPPLAGRFVTGADGYVYISCNDTGVDFVHASATHIFIRDVIGSVDVPDHVKGFFPMDRTVSHRGHFSPLLSVQVTELADGIFIGYAVNHSVTDGTSLWNFFNTFAEVSGVKRIIREPDFTLNSILISNVVLKLPADGPKVTFSGDAPLRERIFSFSRQKFQTLKAKTNNQKLNYDGDFIISIALCIALACSDTCKEVPTFPNDDIQNGWDVLSHDLHWCAEQLNKNVKAHDDVMVRKFVEDWEKDPQCFPLGNFDGAMLTMGSSPRFPMYDNDFGWGRPVAFRSGRANKFDGKIPAFPGREGGGSVDVEVIFT